MRNNMIMTTGRPVIAQHCFGTAGLGGPMSGVQRLLDSELAEKYDFRTCFQNRPARGISPSLLREMARQLRAIRPDLLHVRGLQNEGFHGLLAGRMAGCRRILVSVHGFVGDLQRPRSRWKQRFVSDLLEPWTLRRADGVYCVCEYASARRIVRRHARRVFPAIHNAMPLCDLKPPHQELRSSLGIDSEDVLAVYVGRISREKGVFDLCRAIRQREEPARHRLRLLFVGDGPDRVELEQFVQRLQLPGVVFAGQRDDVSDLLAISDFAILPSWHENLPNAILEAMHAAKAVIASAVGGCAEVVEDGSTGILVPPKSPDALGHAIQRLTDAPSLRTQMGLAGRQRIESRFSMTQMTQRLDHVYQEMLAS